MSRSALSLRVFGFYLLGTGALLVFAPNLLLGLVRLPPTHEIWIRVLGVVVFIVGSAALLVLASFGVGAATRGDVREHAT